MDHLKTDVVITDRSGDAPAQEVDMATLVRLGEQVIPACQDASTFDDAPLMALQEVEVAILADSEMGEVHEQFMGVPGSTDVITFHHGEILIGVQEAERQAPLHGEPVDREIFRYLVHGLLHLAGHEDKDPTEREAMHKVQEEIIASAWPKNP